MPTLRWVACALTLMGLWGCGGSSVSVLHAVAKPTGEGAAALRVKNASGATIHGMYVASAERVERASSTAVDPSSAEGAQIWGVDRLGNAGLGEGATFDGLSLTEGRYDVLVIDPDHREQMVKGLHVHAGGKYVLELKDDWTIGR